MTTRSRAVLVRLRLRLAVVAAVLFPMVASGTVASAETIVPYQFDGLAFYQFGAPADLCCGPIGSPDTGFIRITNSGPSTFAGLIGFIAEGGNGVDYSQLYSVTLNPGDHVSISINNESSNQGGYNGFSGAEFMMSGMVSLWANSQSVFLSIFDRDIHSGSPRTNPDIVAPANFGDAARASTCAISPVSSTSFSGNVANLADANSQATTADFTATIDWGDGSSSAGTVTGPTGGPFMVSGSHTYASTGPELISATVTDDGGSPTAVSGCTVLIFAPVSTGGAFVIGDGNSALGTAVTFWGAQWSTLNTLSGGPAPSSFKGFALSPATPSCGADWSTDPGNSVSPPAGPLPAFIGVIVTSSSSQSGSQISGDTVHMVVVQTNNGYAPAVGHAGTGRVVAQVC